MYSKLSIGYIYEKRWKTNLFSFNRMICLNLISSSINSTMIIAKPLLIVHLIQNDPISCLNTYFRIFPTQIKFRLSLKIFKQQIGYILTKQKGFFNNIIKIQTHQLIKSQNSCLMQLTTCYQSSPNIALIKYWGKYDENYILPINDSVGLTLDPHDFHTKTTITFSQKFDADKLILNSKEHPKSQRLETVFKVIRQKAHQRYPEISSEEWKKYHFYVESVNSFPTASGMASSASGLACLATALNGLFGNILTEKQLSQLARFGSGSASRSVFGGLVQWKGVPNELIFAKEKVSEERLQKLSKECISFSIRDKDELSFIKIICLLATNKEKQTSSTKGMRLSVQTSELIKYRNEIASKRITQIQNHLNIIKDARQNKNKQNQYQAFNKFCQVIIKDSNQFHAICLDTYPPIFYLNEFSKQVIEVVDHYINKQSPIKVAYTFDAGPHAFLFVHEDNVSEVLTYLQKTFNIQEEQLNDNAREINKNGTKSNTQSKISVYSKQTIKPYALWSTRVGPGSKPYELGQNDK